MKRKSLIAVLMWAVASAGMAVAQTQTGEDVSEKIVNPSFETNGLEGWTNNGLSSQTNDSPTKEGWTKDGQVYAEKWTSASEGGHLSDASIMQQLKGLKPGSYVLRAEAHAVNQSGTPAVCKGVELVAGYFSTPVTKGGTYEVKTVVSRSGELSIGFRAVQTDANWMAVDHFRLEWMGEQAEDYRAYLNEVVKKAHDVEKLMNEWQGYANRNQLADALAQADAAATTDALLDAIDAVEQVCKEWETIRTSYTAMREKIVKFRQTLSESGFAGKEALAVSANDLEGWLTSGTDVRDRFDWMTEQIESCMELLYAWQRLHAGVTNAQMLLATSQYDGHEAFADVIHNAAATLEQATELTVLDNGAEALLKAQRGYLSHRPSEWVTIKNGALWKDTEGNSVQAHGAGFLLVGDTWYMIGENRIASWNPDVNMYSSKDLKTWKFERTIIKNGVTHPDLGNGRFIERPKLMYNARTGKYVVWCHWEQSNYGASEAAAFECDVVNGDYKYVWSGRPLGVKSRDCNVFVDEDGAAYFISTTSEHTNLGLFRLTDDYLAAADHTVLLPGQRREAPAIVKVRGKYYMLSSACSGWDPNQCKLSTSDKLTEGWTGLSNLGNGIAYDTQAASILTICGTKDTTYLYVGDRWQDPDLPQSKTIIFPISFVDGRCTFTYHQQFDINFVTGEWRETPQENTARIDKRNWSIKSVSSEETASENAAAQNAIDGDLTTIWHTQYSGTPGKAPFSVTVDMGEEHPVCGFLAMPRTDNNSTNGLVREFLLEVSTDAKNWQLVSGSSWMPYAAEVYFPTVKARYFRFTSLSGTYASVAEFDMLTDAPKVDADAITPYVKVGDEENWSQISDVKAPKGSNVTFGPSVANGALGTWAFSGPNRLHRSTTRENVVSKISAKDAGTYTSVFLNAYGMTSVQNFTLALGNPTSIGGVSADKGKQVAALYCFSMDGRLLKKVPEHGPYVVRTLFSDGTWTTSKCMGALR